MAVSIIGLMTNAEPLEFIGRYILESGPELTNTLLQEYKKRFNDPEKFATWLLKYHWHTLTNSPFGSYMVSMKLAIKRMPRNPVPIFLGDVVRNTIYNEEIQFAEKRHASPIHINCVYIISINGQELILYYPNENKTGWIATERFSLVPQESEKNILILP